MVEVKSWENLWGVKAANIMSSHNFFTEIPPCLSLKLYLCVKRVPILVRLALLVKMNNPKRCWAEPERVQKIWRASLASLDISEEKFCRVCAGVIS